MFCKKRKRKIIVKDKIYYWCVTVDKDTGLDPIALRVFSENKYLFGICYKFKWHYIPEPDLKGYRCLSEPFSIKPSLVREQILNYLETKKA